MKNWIYITMLSEKFSNQCKEQTNSKMPSNIFLLYKASSWIWWLSCVKNKLGSQIYSLDYKYNVCFIKLENLVYQNNPFIIYAIGQSSIQHTTLNQLNIPKQVFLNIYHFPSTLVSSKYQDPFIWNMLFLNPVYLADSCRGSEFQRSLFNGLWISIAFPIQSRSVLE